ncbi:nuclear transport factor 2 family protein [Pseudoalteromonas piscicida]|uniref:Peptidase n=1 Tax=Pseudoalteromonas piscicida TaxID=43662 RepID=A0A2A5JT90_PSEO7|nr:nuclear transport factor 2 family protein [Pseudoalteromonas piscicida]PCK32635.1 peptidase [Pseudoalteromonas piscicida]
MTLSKLVPLLLLLLIHCGIATALEDETANIETTLSYYISGTANNQPEAIKKAFHPNAILILEKANDAMWQVPLKEYLSWYKGFKKDTGRRAKILNISVNGMLAQAKIRVDILKSNVQYIDHLLLKKLDGRWQIISKSAQRNTLTLEQQNNLGRRVLIVASSKAFHGDSQLPAGTSFDELLSAYDIFTQAGLMVDFVSTQGGALNLSYINTSNDEHKKYLYQPDYMYALSNTMRPAEVDPSQYAAIYYVGGSNAMYEVAENLTLQRIAMHIYEQNQGVIAAVCHGTAGIVNLRLKNGEYLIKGKQITGYPTAFENPDRAYFKHFPFQIQPKVEALGGNFEYGERNDSFIKVDSRIVTGQNYQSSQAVANSVLEYIYSIK